MPHAVVYVRVSSDEQVKGMSLDFQQADCRAYAERKGLVIDQIYEDRGESAKFADRPQLIQMLEHCRNRQRQIDALIVWKLDRLSRNQEDYFHFKRLLRGYGIALYSATEPSMDDSNSIAGKVFEAFSALQAEIDNTIRGERARRGCASRLATGIYPWAPPLGYGRSASRQRGDKKNAPDEPLAGLFPIIQAALRDYARGGYSQRDLVGLLNDRGFGEVHGKKAYPQMVNHIFYHSLDFYRGVLVNPWTGERHQGRHEPMITEEEHSRIVALRDGRSVGKAVKRRKVHPLFPLRRTLRCAGCGEFHTASVSRGHGGLFPYYHCRTKGCSAYGKGVRKETVEAEFEKLAAEHTLTAEFLLALKKALEDALMAKQGDAGRRAEAQGKKLGELAARLRRIYEMREDGTYDKEGFLERKRQIEGEIAALKMQESEAEEGIVDLDKLFAFALDFVAQFGAGWAGMPLEIQQRFQQILFPEGISYDREKGFGTSILGPIFKLKEEFERETSKSVRFVGFSWNLIVADLRRMGEGVGPKSPEWLCAPDPGHFPS